MWYYIGYYVSSDEKHPSYYAKHTFVSYPQNEWTHDKSRALKMNKIIARIAIKRFRQEWHSPTLRIIEEI